jgi:hypothetical protein
MHPEADLNLELDRGAHACQLFEDPAEQRLVTLRFIKDGLSRRERCVHITTEPSVDDWYRGLEAAGIDVVSERQAGSLEVLGAVDWYLKDDFQSVILARRLWQMIDRDRRVFSGIRITADMRWTLENLLAEELCHWEATANLVFEDVDVRVICQYDLSYHSVAEIHAALRTHPVVVYQGSPRSNPFYEAPAILANEPHLNGSDADAADIEAMLGRLRQTT